MTDLKVALTSEEQHKKDLERLEKMRPLDDDLMRELFRNNIPLAQFVLRIMTGKDDLVITSEETQYDMERLLGARSICLDVLATDSEGRKFNLEIQRADKGATPQRARYHSSAMDVEFLSAKQNFDELPITYVIFVTENDVRKGNRPVYTFERADIVTGESFGDGEYILFVNGAYTNQEDNSDLAKLIHDFRCNDADDMYFDLMSHMCKIMEDMRNEAAKEAERLKAIQFAINLLNRGKETFEEIAEDSGLTLAEVQELAEQLKPVTT